MKAPGTQQARDSWNFRSDAKGNGMESSEIPQNFLSEFWAACLLRYAVTLSSALVPYLLGWDEMHPINLSPTAGNDSRQRCRQSMMFFQVCGVPFPTSMAPNGSIWMQPKQHLGCLPLLVHVWDESVAG
jgi:hypothetical protein